PIGMALTPDGTLLYVADFGANEVRLLRTADNSLLPTRVPVGRSPVAIAITSRPRQAAFDFALDSLSVDGNILGRGNPDGQADFFDGFDDGSLTTLPTSLLYFP